MNKRRLIKKIKEIRARENHDTYYEYDSGYSVGWLEACNEILFEVEK